MSELITNLNNILDIKGNIKSAIENKGVDMTGVSFSGYASKIGEISGGGGWDQKSFTEEIITFINIDNSASFVASSAFKNNTTINLFSFILVLTVSLQLALNTPGILYSSIPCRLNWSLIFLTKLSACFLICFSWSFNSLHSFNITSKLFIFA